MLATQASKFSLRFSFTLVGYFFLMFYVIFLIIICILLVPASFVPIILYMECLLLLLRYVYVIHIVSSSVNVLVIDHGSRD